MAKLAYCRNAALFGLTFLVVSSPLAHASDVNVDGFRATKSYQQQASFEEFIGVATMNGNPAADAVLRCGLTPDGKPFPAFSSFYAKLQHPDQEISLETRIIDGTVLATMSSPEGDRHGRPWIVQTLTPAGSSTTKYCAWQETTDTLVNCSPAPPFASAADLKRQEAVLRNYCANFMGQSDVQASLSADKAAQATSAWQAFILGQRQMLETLAK